MPRNGIGKGRKKGVPNKNTQQLRDMILGALDNQPGGGVAYLERQAKENPGPFMSLLGKVLPTTILANKDDTKLTISIKRLEP